jgi:NAD(P)H dehydrogenase (quinone)
MARSSAILGSPGIHPSVVRFIAVMTILITAAGGKLGRLTIEALMARGVAPAEIVAGARNPGTLSDLAAQGVGVRELDYDRAETAAAAFEGVDQVLLISSPTPGNRAAQHQTVIDAAAAAGVRQLVYTSAPKATTSPLILAPEHKATEEAILASGVPATILRNSWYTETYLPQLVQARSTGEVVASVGDGRVASATRRDYAEGAAAALTSAEHIGQTYELSGDVAWNFDELAATIGSIIGRDVVFRDVSPEELVEILSAAGLDDGTAGFVVALDQNIKAGLLAETSGDLSRLIGHPTTPLAEGLAQAAAVE